MNSYLSVINSSEIPAVSVYCDNTPTAVDIIAGHQSKFHICPAGSRTVTVINNRGRVIFDLWLSLAPKKKHILEIFTDSCLLSPPFP